MRPHPLAFLVLAVVATWASSQDLSDRAFAPVQPELFGVAGALSNAWADYDGDGDLDLAVSFQNGEARLYRHDAAGFVDATDRFGVLTRGRDVRALAWSDMDADGDLDLYVGARDAGALLRNDGNGTFQNVATELGVLPNGKLNTRQATWLDIEKDGDLDLHVAHRSGPNMLFLGTDGRFVESAAKLGLADTRKTVGVCWFDMDQDGDLDAYQAHQEGDSDAFYRNDGRKFTDIAGAAGMDRPGRPKEEGSVGCTVGDYDNDGDLDLFVASYGTNALYRNDGRGHFSEVAAQLGLATVGHAVAASWGDYDNDGDLDLYVTDYRGESQSSTPASHLFRNDGERFVDVLAPDSPLAGADHGVQWIDYDGDGDLDLSLTRGYTAVGGCPLFRNELGGRSLQVQVLDRAGRHTSTGAEVRIFDRSGRLLGTRVAAAADGYNSQSAIPVHFGLGRVKRVNVEVTYLTASGRSTQRVEGVAFGRPLVVRQR